MLLIFSVGCSHAENKKDLNMGNVEEFFIEGNKVTKQEFEALKKGMKRPNNKSRSFETPQGGETVYDLVDSKGHEYEFVSESKNGNYFISTIREKH